MYLQSDLLRIVWAIVNDDGAPQIKAMHGTAFLLGRSGVFLTARHVIDSAFAQNPDDFSPAILGATEDGKLTTEAIREYEIAPGGQDIAIGLSDYICDSMYLIANSKHTVWQEVLSAGYPEDAFVREGHNLKTPLRAFKGIVQRLVKPGDLHLAPETDGFELSFSPSPGMSGAPLCLPRWTGSLGVFGVCVGAFRSEQVEDEFVEVNNDGSRYAERRVRITQFGLAESLYPLLDWRPKLLGGASLKEAFGREA
jgi:hypothetical protein